MNSARLTRTEGRNLVLRLVRPEDAAYIHSLRSDPRYNRHLSPATGGVEGQRDWIERYLEREAAGTEFYYVIERRSDGLACGLIRLYGIAEGRFTWGSWILDRNKPPKAALESALLSFGLGFNELGCTLALIDVRTENTHALAFYRRFGMTEVGNDDENIYLHYPRERFERDEAGYWRLIEGGVPE